MSKWKCRKIPEYITFSQVWPDSPGLGKFWKRKMHKARRRAWKQGRDWRDEKYGENYRGSEAIESTVNYRTW